MGFDLISMLYLEKMIDRYNTTGIEIFEDLVLTGLTSIEQISAAFRNVR